MIFAPVDPATARQYFKRRVLQSVIVLGGTFLLLTTLFSWVSSLMFQSLAPMLLGAGLAGLIVYYAFIIWNKQPMRIRCRTCNGIVACKTPWVCGECGHENWGNNGSTLLDGCENCGLLSKAYICHHCEKPMFFSEDQDVTNPAMRITAEARQPRRRAAMQNRGDEKFVSEKTELERDVEKAKLVLAKEQINAQIDVAKKGIMAAEGQIQTALDIQAQGLRKFMDVATAISEAARRQKALNAVECKDNPADRRRRDLIVDEWIRRELAKGP